ncbi:MAG: hypothetical protein P4M07_06395 [Xanthobacteraceae bacterium]|nr:hypothetical protein [Xanthobacteraceae bacterium]
MSVAATRLLALIVVALIILLIVAEFGPAVRHGEELAISDERPAPEFTLGPPGPM